MKPANYSPVYCALYPKLTEIARKHGYCMSVHGSMARDFDVICVPWIELPSHPTKIIEEFCSTFDIRNLFKEPTEKLHGRMVYTISIGFGECFMDLSFMPTTNNLYRESNENTEGKNQ